MSEEKKETEETTSGFGKELFSFLIELLIIMLLAVGFMKFVAQKTVVSGSSMESTLSDGDHLIINKISYRFSDPKRFDIVVFPYEYEEDTYYIKRVIGLPGETIWLNDGKIYINGEVLEEDYGLETFTDAGIAAEPIVLGEDEYFLMGDNRNRSKDSRDPLVGVVNGDDFVGKAVFRIWPFGRIGSIND